MAKAPGSFLGRGWSFPPSFNLATREVAMVEDEADIRESLAVLLSTNRGERVLRPEFGFGLQAHVFDAADPTTITHIASKIEDAVLYFEPRIEVERVAIDASRAAAEGVLTVDVAYRILATNSRSNMVFPFYFEEGTNVRVP